MYLSSGVGGLVFWRPAELHEHPSDPHNDERRKPGEDVPQAGNVRPVVRVQVGLDRIVKGENHNQEDGAAEPGKVGAQELHRLRQVFGGEPVAFVRKVDQLGWQPGDNPWDAKSDCCGKNAHGDKKSKERRLRLPAIGHAAPVEVRSYDIGQLSVVGRKIDRPPTARTSNSNLGSLPSRIIVLNGSVSQRGELHKVSARVGASVVTAFADPAGNHTLQIAKMLKLTAPGLSPCVIE